jgi:hypothetical protein
LSLPVLNSGNLELLDNPRLVNQLCSLERRTGGSGRDIIDHPRRGNFHDDLPNVVAGVVMGLAAKARACISRMRYWQGAIVRCRNMVAVSRAPFHGEEESMVSVEQRGNILRLGILMSTAARSSKLAGRPLSQSAVMHVPSLARFCLRPASEENLAEITIRRGVYRVMSGEHHGDAVSCRLRANYRCGRCDGDDEMMR